MSTIPRPAAASPPHPSDASRAGRRLPEPSSLMPHWGLDPAVVFLNHGSFGACPRAVLEEQARLRAEMEREPVRFFVERYTPLMDEARAALAAFVRCEAEDLLPMPNASVGVTTALEHAGESLSPGDEVLASTHEYPACMNNVRRVASRRGAAVVAAAVPFPIASEDEAVAAVLGAVTARTRVALISHVTSPSGVILPVERIVPELEGRGIVTIVDGAHAPGQVPGLALGTLGASYYAANCHKWVCSPKGSALLHVRRDRQKGLRPLVLSNNAEKPRPGRKHLLTEFDYTGTEDRTAWMTIPAAISAMAAMVEGGWPEVMRRNHELALEARRVLCRALGTEPPAPEGMIGSMATVWLPEHEEGRRARLASRPTRYNDALQDALIERHGIQSPLWVMPGKTRRFVRVSAQLYNSIEQYEYLAGALLEEMERERGL